MARYLLQHPLPKNYAGECTRMETYAYDSLNHALRDQKTWFLAGRRWTLIDTVDGWNVLYPPESLFWNDRQIQMVQMRREKSCLAG